MIFCASEYRFCNDGWTGFTIGIGPKIIDYINNNKNFDNIQFGSHENTVLCKISDWTDQWRRPNEKNRKTIINNLANNGIINTCPKFDFREYMILDDVIQYYDGLAKHKFIISPEGNSKDSHRHYEAVLAGSIPIMEYSKDMECIYEGLPILWTDDYSEIKEDYLLNKYEEMLDKEFDFSKMFLYNYPEEEKKQIIDNANYWIGDGRWGERWYE